MSQKFSGYAALRFRLKARFDGAAHISDQFQCDTGDYRVGFELSAGGAVTHVWADCPIPNPHELVPRFTPGDDGVHQLTVPHIPQEEELRGVLQYLESIGSFWLGVEKIGWGQTTREWIAENDHDRALTTVFSMSASEDYNTTPVAIDGEAEPVNEFETPGG